MLYESAYFSLIIQFIVGLINIYGLNLEISPDKQIFKDILKLEFGVQLVEFIFYSWMISNFNTITNITPFRYVDWIFTTPTMLITLMSFLDSKKNTNLKDYISKNKSFIIEIVILNIVMILFGLAGELGYMEYNTSIIAGFIPFIYYFKLIYDKYINSEITKDKKILYWFFFFIWSLYGIVAFLPYEEKNTSYNILDLFSKNLFSVFLVIYLYKFKK